MRIFKPIASEAADFFARGWRQARKRLRHLMPLAAPNAMTPQRAAMAPASAQFARAIERRGFLSRAWACGMEATPSSTLDDVGRWSATY